MNLIRVPLAKLSLHPIYGILLSNHFEYSRSELFIFSINLPVAIRQGKIYMVVFNARSYLVNSYHDLMDKKREGNGELDVLLMSLSEEQINTSIILDILSSSLQGRTFSTTQIAEMIDKIIADKQLSIALMNTLGLNSMTSFIKDELDINYQSCIKKMTNKAKRQKPQLQKVFCKTGLEYNLFELNYTKIINKKFINLLCDDIVVETIPVGCKNDFNIGENEYRFLNLDNYDFLIDTNKKAVSYYIPKLEIVLFLSGEKAVIKPVNNKTIPLHECSVLLRESKNSISYEYKSVQYVSSKRKTIILPIYAIDKLRESGYGV